MERGKTELSYIGNSVLLNPGKVPRDKKRCMLANTFMSLQLVKLLVQSIKEAWLLV